MTTSNSGMDKARAARGEAAETERDAARWRALMSSQRMHYMGSANFEMTKRDPEGPHGKLFNLNPTPKAGKYMHFGMEFWSEYRPPEGMELDSSFEHRLLTAYVDEIIRRNPTLLPQPIQNGRDEQ